MHTLFPPFHLKLDDGRLLRLKAQNIILEDSPAAVALAAAAASGGVASVLSPTSSVTRGLVRSLSSSRVDQLSSNAQSSSSAAATAAGSLRVINQQECDSHIQHASWVYLFVCLFLTVFGCWELVCA
jgi:hypothetical protein